MKIMATASLPAVDRPNANRWNAARLCQFSVYSTQKPVQVAQFSVYHTQKSHLPLLLVLIDFSLSQQEP